PTPQRNELLIVITHIVVNPKVNVTRILQHVRPRHFNESLTIPRVVVMDRNVLLRVSGIINFNRPAVGTTAITIGSPGDARIYRLVIEYPVITYFLVVTAQPDRNGTPTPLLQHPIAIVQVVSFN